MISGPFSFWTGLGLHSEFVHKRILAVIQTAAADQTTPILVFVTNFADLEKVDHFFVSSGFHSGGNVMRHGFRVVASLFEDRRKFPGLAGTGRIDLFRVFCFDFQTADSTDAVFSFFDEMAVFRHCSRSTFLSHRTVNSPGTNKS